MNTTPHFVHFRTDGVSFLLETLDAKVPAVVHWGKDLGSISAAEAHVLTEGIKQHRTMNDQDVPPRLDLLATHEGGYQGRFGLVGGRANGAGWTPKFTLTSIDIDGAAASINDELVELEAGTSTFTLADADENLAIKLTVEGFASGIFRARAELTNTGNDSYEVRELGVVFPVPNNATEIMDFAGHWTKERAPQRRDFTVGTHVRENRKGRTGADSAFVLSAGTQGFNFSQGQVWGVHTAFSGNHRMWAERMYTGIKVVGGSELLHPGEAILGPDESYSSPWIFALYGEGQDDQMHRVHRWMRARDAHPQRTRPVTLNVWEAVYFNHDLEKLKALAYEAAELGIERFVLDDGWFGSRRDDFSGLGDWVVSADVWPNGLAPIIEHVNSLGMEFGLWFEPEMVNPDSDVARAHPEWLMAPNTKRLPVEGRHQQVMNLSIPEAYAHVRDQMVAVLRENPNIVYIKWDHNRDIIEGATQATGTAAIHEQTLAAYRLMDELHELFPGLEIEACASGGGRIDLEVLQRTQRVWTSDDIDPFERQQMQRWTTQLVPPEMMGTHVASGHSHSTGRWHSIHFRCATAMWGHMGVEWDLTQATGNEFAELKEWITLHKKHRDLLHTGTVIRMDQHEPTSWIHGVVAQDGSEALFAIHSLGLAETAPIGRFRLRGLEPDALYTLTDVTPGEDPQGYRTPAWAESKTPLVLSGRSLMNAGLHLPGLFPETSRILHLEAHTN